MTNQKENQSLKVIAKHICVLNKEVGSLKIDVKWIKRIVYYMAGALSIGIGKVLFYPI